MYGDAQTAPDAISRGEGAARSWGPKKGAQEATGRRIRGRIERMRPSYGTERCCMQWKADWLLYRWR